MSKLITVTSNNKAPTVDKLQHWDKPQPHMFKVGDGASTGGNGDSYPYRVVAVSKSGKSVTMRPMGYKASEPNLPMGHDSWEVFDHPEDKDVGTIIVTLRSNGKWAPKGSSSQGGYGCFYPGARYSYNWSF